MTIADAVKIHHVSERTVRRWIATGRLPAVVVDGVTHVSARGVELVAEDWRATRHRRRARPRVLDLSAVRRVLR